MNLLQNIQNGTLYNLDCTVFSKVRFSSESPEKATFIFSSDPTASLPEHLLLMPDGEEYDYSSFFYTLSPKVEICQPGISESVSYLVEGTTRELLTARNELRIDVSFDIPAVFDEHDKEEIITIKNMSAGGFFFVSEKQYYPDHSLSFIFNNGMTPILVTAKIRNQRPTRFPKLHGYGCQFFGLSAKTEAAVRNYVFKNEVLQRKKLENLSQEDI